MNKFEIQDAGFNIGVNVVITKRDIKTGKILDERRSHNRCLRQQLLGIAKFLNGEYSHTAPEGEQDYYNWIPRYLGVGTNISAGGEGTVGTQVSVNDTRLLNEISPRMKLPEKNKLISRSNQNYIQLVIDTYLPSKLYNGNKIAEAGLFSKETGNNCLFRLVFPEIEKDENSVIQVNWTITIISISSTSSPTEIVDKTDLELAFEKALNKIGNLYPNTKQLCDYLFENTLNKGAIGIYADTYTDQDTVNETQKQINKLTEDLK